MMIDYLKNEAGLRCRVLLLNISEGFQSGRTPRGHLVMRPPTKRLTTKKGGWGKREEDPSSMMRAINFDSFKYFNYFNTCDKYISYTGDYRRYS
jgi:hypothetical protein